MVSLLIPLMIAGGFDGVEPLRPSEAYEMQRNSRRIEVGWEKPRRKGVTAIARRLGYSKTYVSQVLAGKLKPGAPLAAKLKRLGVEVA